MTFETVNLVFQAIVFLFAISIHESAHAWMANRRGDPTANMLGRITLNPIKHIDPIGTILLPAIAWFAHMPVLGWAKPTPVNPRNFKNPVLDDVLTSVAGPVSNFLTALVALGLLLLISLTSPTGREIVHETTYGIVLLSGGSLLVPLSMLLYNLLLINVVLAVFNLIPIPPLDGSHVLRHALSGPALALYDRIGFFGLLALVYFGPGLLSRLISPFMAFFIYFLR
ncbi:MAG: site-2 protease family protein [Acidobacteria bacterium]|nr:MAG: site-2 protease family protein [Acidobacteriota bacterium]PYY10163.1 MAG: site-2 protease family protein [Acidobacteriota bacterium]